MNKLEEIFRNTLGDYAMQAARLQALLAEANARVSDLEKQIEQLTQPQDQKATDPA